MSYIRFLLFFGFILLPLTVQSQPADDKTIGSSEQTAPASEINPLNDAAKTEEDDEPAPEQAENTTPEPENSMMEGAPPVTAQEESPQTQNPAQNPEMTEINEVAVQDTGKNVSAKSCNKDESRLTSELIKDAHIDRVKEFLLSNIVILSIKDNNIRNKDIGLSEINSLDAQWRKERNEKDKPLIAATLSNPLSSYLTRVQAHSVGLYTEIFVMDNKGLNVGQSNITTDYWQGDEDKWLETFGNENAEIFIDKEEYNEQFGVWVAQLSITIMDPESGRAIGAATAEINLNEIKRRAQLMQ